jgi:tetratricopeptide (TPR) repeat protein
LAGAARAYREALALLPTGRDACRESVWVHAALGDLHMHAADFVEASKAFDRAIHCTSHALETPYLQWRLGQSLYERGDYDQAANSLRAACRNGGRNLFAQEDPKYQAFLQSHRPTPTPLSRAKPTDMLDEQIGSCVKQVAGLLSEAAGGTKVWGSHFGPTSLDPNHLLVYFVFPGRADVSAAQESHAWADAKRHLRDMLKAAGVSAERLQSYRVELYSEEQCKEEANGNWYHFFK